MYIEEAEHITKLLFQVKMYKENKTMENIMNILWFFNNNDRQGKEGKLMQFVKF